MVGLLLGVAAVAGCGGGTIWSADDSRRAADAPAMRATGGGPASAGTADVAAMSAGAPGFGVPSWGTFALFITRALIDGGKWHDQYGKKPADGAAKEKYGLAADAALLAIIIGVSLFDDPKEDPALARLDALKEQIEKLQEDVTEIKNKVSAVEAQVQKIGCYQQGAKLWEPLEKIKIAYTTYSSPNTGVMVRAATAAGQAAQGKRAEDPWAPPELRELRKRVRLDMPGYLMTLNDAAFPSQQTGEGWIAACAQAVLTQFRQAPSVFDDRRYYDPLTEMLKFVTFYQAQGLSLYQAVMVADAADAIKAALAKQGRTMDEDELPGLCRRAIDANEDDPWHEGADPCKRVREQTEYVRRSLIAQIEATGAPYTDDRRVMAIGQDVADRGDDKGRYTQKWLWLADHCDVSDPNDGCAATRGRFDADFDRAAWRDFPGGYPKDLWVPGNQDSWRASLHLADALGKQQGDERPDLFTYMSNAGMTHVADTTFWMRGWTTPVRWADLSTARQDQAPSPEKWYPEDTVKCFARSGWPRNADMPVAGVMCGTPDLTAVKEAWRDKASYAATYRVRSRDPWPRGDLGELSMAWRGVRYTGFDYPERYCEQGKSGPCFEWLPAGAGTDGFSPILPGHDASLHRMPVLDVNTLRCTPPMDDGNATEIGRLRPRLNPAKVPTMCGDDMTRYVNGVVGPPPGGDPDAPSAAASDPGAWTPEVDAWIDGARVKAVCTPPAGGFRTGTAAGVTVVTTWDVRDGPVTPDEAAPAERSRWTQRVDQPGNAPGWGASDALDLVKYRKDKPPPEGKGRPSALPVIVSCTVTATNDITGARAEFVSDPLVITYSTSRGMGTASPDRMEFGAYPRQRDLEVTNMGGLAAIRVRLPESPRSGRFRVDPGDCAVKDGQGAPTGRLLGPWKSCTMTIFYEGSGGAPLPVEDTLVIPFSGSRPARVTLRATVP